MNRACGSVPIFIAGIFLAAFHGAAIAQDDNEPLPSPKATVLQVVGVDTEVTIVFHRPAVRRGEVGDPRVIWGELVPYDAVWRAGANATTTISFSKGVKIQGKALAAGTYGFFILPSEGEYTVVFSKESGGNGGYPGEEADALRVTVTPVAAEYQERLVYGFEKLQGLKGTAFLHWETLKIPFEIDTDS